MVLPFGPNLSFEAVQSRIEEPGTDYINPCVTLDARLQTSQSGDPKRKS